MTHSEAEQKTGLTARFVGGTQNPFLTCQLGVSAVETRSSNAKQGSGGGCIHRGYKVNTRIFTLVAYGRTWEDAVKMALKRK